MTKLFKNSKQVLSFVLAFAVLAVSLFTGVVINSDAACANKVVKYWDGTTKTEPTETDKDGNILISSPAELAWLAENGSTATAKYKVADGIDAFIMQPETVVDAEELMAIDSYEETKTYFETLAASDNKPVKWIVKAANYSATGSFLGTFDGNGIEIYGLYHNENAWNTTALFPFVGANVTIKNLAVRNSYLAIQSYAGAVFGTSADGGDNDRITVDSVAVTGTWIYNTEATLKNNGTPDDPSDDYIQYFADRSGMMFGRVGGLIDISNCFVYANKVTNANNQDLPYAFAPSIKNTWTTKELNHSYSNCVLLGGYPYNKTSFNAYYAELFSNVYTDKPVDEGKYSYNESQMAQITVDGVKGAAGMAAMDLDWDNVWLATEGLPELRVFHDVADEATKGTNGHTYKCADCELVTAEYPHTYGADGVCTACGADKICGSSVAYYSGTPATSIANVGGGDGSSADKAIIIASAEELAYLANGADGNTAGKYYKISSGIDALVLQPESYAEAIMALDSAEAVKKYFEDNKSSMKPWVTGTSTTVNFDGTLDGSGVTIYGMASYTTSASNGLLPFAGDFTLKNIGIENSYVKGDFAAIVCGKANEIGTAVFENCVIANNVAISNRKDNGAAMAGLLIGTNAGYDKEAGKDTYTNVGLTVSDCLIYGNSVTHTQYSVDWQGNKYHEKEYDINYGLWGNVSAPVGATISNSIILDTAPYSITYASNAFKNSTYTNVYTNMLDMTIENIDWASSGTVETKHVTTSTVNEDGSVDMTYRRYDNDVEYTGSSSYDRTFAAGSFVKVDANSIKGAAGKDLLSELDWSKTWIAVNGATPELRIFHDAITAVDNEDGTHSESCNCGLVGATAVAHTFDKAATGGTCSVCGAACTTHGMGDPNYDAQLGAFEWIESEEGTCETAPKGQLVCSICGFSSPAGIDYPYFEAGHKNIKHVDAEEPTCTEDGTVEHWHCDDCGNNYTTEAATTKLDSIVDPTEGHKAVVGDDGKVIYYMGETGYHAKTCSVCGENFDRTECSGSSYEKDAEGHIGTCDTCGMGLSDKQDHIFDENKQDTNNTCLTCGWTCQSHGMGDPNYDAQLGAFEWIESEKGTCDTAPKGQLVCSICGFSSPADIDYPYFEAKEHVEGKPEESDREESSCTEDGSYVETIKCTECDEVISTTTKTIDKKGHNFIAFDGYDADCTYTGEIPHKSCDECDKYFDADEIDVYSTDYKDYATDIMTPVVPDAHIWVEVEAKDASCEEDGNIEYKYCELCTLLVVGDKETELAVFDDTFYEKLEKAWDENITDDMTEEEYEEVWPPIYYSILGDAVEEAAAEEGIELTIAGGHKLTEVKEVAATTEKEGTKAHYTCSECDKLFADAEGKTEVKAADLVIAKLAAEDKGNDKTDDNKTDDNKADGDKSNESPKTGESVAVVAAVAALMGAAFVIIRKARKA